MKEIALLSTLALTLASCAPSKPVTRQVTYTATCENVMGQLLSNAATIRPGKAVDPDWSPYLSEGGYTPNSTTASGFTLTSHSILKDDTILVRTTCTEANGTATVTLTNTGQDEAFAKTSQDALLGLIKLSPLPES